MAAARRSALELRGERRLVLNGDACRIRFVNSRKVAVAIVGAVVLLLGVVFALQGANIIGGSALMSGVSTYIYVGAALAVVGFLVLLWASRMGTAPKPTTQPSPAPATQ